MQAARRPAAADCDLRDLRVRPWAVSGDGLLQSFQRNGADASLASGFAASAASTTARRLPLLPPIKQRPARASLPVRREQSPR